MMLSATYVQLRPLVMQIEVPNAQTGAQRVAEFGPELAPRSAGPCEVVRPYDKFLTAGRFGMPPDNLGRAFVTPRDRGATIRQNIAAIDDMIVLPTNAEEGPSVAGVH